MDACVYTIGNHQIDVWPKGTRVVPLDSNILVTQFADADIVNPRLTDYLVGRAERCEDVSPPSSRLFGGTKVYNIHEWETPEAELLHARALHFYKQALQTEDAVVDLCWANLYRQGDCSSPHGHGNTTASVVYMLDLGDEDDSEPFCGKFSFVDPRLELCCRETEGIMTSPFFPTMAAGSMIIFPGQLVHFVTPYLGTRPRITLAWNINNHEVAGTTVQGEKPAG